MEDTATLRIGSHNYNLPLIVGTEGEVAIDIRTLRSQSGCITYDEGYANTGSCLSQLTFIDGEAGILRHRGYPIESLAQRASFLELAYLLIEGELPQPSTLGAFTQSIQSRYHVHESVRRLVETLCPSTHPMAALAIGAQALGAYSPEPTPRDPVAKDATGAAARMLMAQLPTVLAFFYRHRLGLRPLYPEGQRPYGEHFLAMLFGDGLQGRWPLPPEATRALDLFLLLHADHEQNCSTSAVRMVASGGASLFASVAAGISALWGPLHGGANMAVLQMLQDIHATGDDGSRFIEKAKTGQAKLMGFGHRVYKRYDPRAAILRQVCEALFKVLHTQDALLDIALRLEQKALSDAYFVERQLYPNVDFYSGILLHALGLPVDFFTALFALGRLPGWMAQWKELNQGGKGRIQRPRQIYIGPQLRPYPGEALPAAQSHASP